MAQLTAEGQLFVQLELQRIEAHGALQYALLLTHANAGEPAPFYVALLEYERSYRLAAHLKLILYNHRDL